MVHPICIGDFVCIYSEESCGFIFSFQSNGANNEVAVGVDQTRESPSLPIASGSAVFQICVQNRYKFNKELPKLRKLLQKDPGNVRLHQMLKQAQIAQEAAEAESLDNDLEQKRQTGSKLSYGQLLQLRHEFTGKYIHVRTTHTSRTETSNMLVELKHGNAKKAWFRILPRYKVKSEGDMVQPEDQLVLESVKSPGQYLHCSRFCFHNDFVYSSCRELNLSVVPSGFCIYRYRHPVKIQQELSQFELPPEECISGGDVVRLYHRELEAYLVAESLRDADKSSPVFRYHYEEGKLVTELVDSLVHLHFRVRAIDQLVPKTLHYSTSAITYWHVEKERSSIDGSVVSQGEQCRFRHMTSGLYLMMAIDGSVGLSNDHNDPRTVFRMYRVCKSDETESILFDSFVRIEHVITGYWLHGDAKESYIQVEDDHSLDSLNWTRAHLKPVLASPTMMYNDAYCLQKVSKDLIDDANFVAGLLPSVHKLIFDINQGWICTTQKLTQMKTMLQELMKFLTDENDLPVKQKQKLLRNFMGSSGLGAAKVIQELVTDNRKIIDRISCAEVDLFCKLIQQQKNYRHLDLLISLCVCNDISLHAHQKFILDKFVQKSVKEASNVLYFFELHKQTLLLSPDNRASWIPLHEYAAQERYSENYMYLESQLKLYSVLCSGRNKYGVDVIVNSLHLLTWDQVFRGLTDKRILPELRAVFCQLVLDMFVNVGTNCSVLDRSYLVYLYQDLKVEGTAIDRIHSIMVKHSMPLPFLNSLKEWILDFLKTDRCMVASATQHNKLLQQVLRLVASLVQFGYYTRAEQIRALLRPLVSIMDGRSDLPFVVTEINGEIKSLVDEYRHRGRFETTPQTAALISAKYECLKIVDLFFNFRCNNRLERFVSLFKSVSSKENTQTGDEIVDLSPMFYAGFDMRQNPKIVQSTLQHLDNIFSGTEYFEEDFADALMVDVLMLFAQYGTHSSASYASCV